MQTRIQSNKAHSSLAHSPLNYTVFTWQHVILTLGLCPWALLGMSLQWIVSTLDELFACMIERRFLWLPVAPIEALQCIQVLLLLLGDRRARRRRWIREHSVWAALYDRVQFVPKSIIQTAWWPFLHALSNDHAAGPKSFIYVLPINVQQQWADQGVLQMHGNFPGMLVDALRDWKHCVQSEDWASL